MRIDKALVQWDETIDCHAAVAVFRSGLCSSIGLTGLVVKCSSAERSQREGFGWQPVGWPEKAQRLVRLFDLRGHFARATLQSAKCKSKNAKWEGQERPAEVDVPPFCTLHFAILDLHLDPTASGDDRHASPGTQTVELGK